MQNILRIIKRKRNLRRLSAVWILLIAIELLVPAFGDQHIFAAADVPGPKTNFSSAAVEPVTEPICDEDSVSSNSSADQNISFQTPSTVCHDECLCHAPAIPNLVPPTINPPVITRERIPVNYDNMVYGLLPLPFHPPKLS